MNDRCLSISAINAAEECELYAQGGADQPVVALWENRLILSACHCRVFYAR
jgi:hypothetical protein